MREEFVKMIILQNEINKMSQNYFFSFLTRTPSKGHSAKPKHAAVILQNKKFIISIYENETFALIRSFFTKYSYRERKHTCRRCERMAVRLAVNV